MMEQGVISQSPRVHAAGASVPFDTRGLVHVYGRNDMSISERMGIEWTVTDPDGMTAERHVNDWGDFKTSPGGEHHFIGDRFPLAKAGTWTISVKLLMNYLSPVIVDTYDGVLCVVTEPVEEFAGTITRKRLEYDGTYGDIPVY